MLRGLRDTYSDDIGEEVRQRGLAKGSSAADEHEEPEMNVQHHRPDLLEPDLGLLGGGVVRSLAPFHNVALLFLGKAPSET